MAIDYSKAGAERATESSVVQTALATANYFRKAGRRNQPADVGSTDANNAVALGIPAVAVGAQWNIFRTG